MNIKRLFEDRRALTVILVLVALSPLFAYAAEVVGYSEPLENTAEDLGAEENQTYEGIMPDYSVPGIDPYTGTLIAGLIGAFVTLLFAYAISAVIAKAGKQ